MIDEKKLYVVVSIIVVEEEYINKYTLSFPIRRRLPPKSILNSALVIRLQSKSDWMDYNLDIRRALAQLGLASVIQKNKNKQTTTVVLII